MLIMNKPVQIQTENRPPWEDWEDHGGFDDEESLMGKAITHQSAPFQERPWYYEKKRTSIYRPAATGIQLSFL